LQNGNFRASQIIRKGGNSFLLSEKRFLYYYLSNLNSLKYLFVFILLSPCALFSQKTTQVELINANSLEGDEKLGKNVFRLLGNVQFKHENVLMYCDSAYRYGDENRFDAFGNIHIKQGDTINVYGDMLKYEGNYSIAHLFNNVRMTDNKMVLTTNNLNYNTSTEVADYYNGGKITDAENILTSNIGYYYTKDKMLFFKDSVVLNNPRYIVECDTLKYNTISKTSFFLGPTTINSKGTDNTFIFCNYGWYNTVTEKSYFSNEAFIQSKNQRLFGDSLLYDRKGGIGNAFGNVEVFDTENKTLISGNRADYFETDQRSVVTGRAMMTQELDKDSLFMHADTLLATWDSITQHKTYFAYPRCRIFKSDLQGKCDSLVYSSVDSTIRFYIDPVLWNDQNQLTADSINILTVNSNLDKMNLYNSSFITSKEDSLRFNQVRGKNMTGYFDDNKLHKINVTGNGQTIYYVKNKKEGKERLTGVNRAECSDLVVFVKDSKVSKIILQKKPAGTLYPINDLKPEELKLKGFTWQEEKRPVSKQDIFEWK
jgi:lipopolysaccharide export system protein LptA